MVSTCWSMMRRRSATSSGERRRRIGQWTTPMPRTSEAIRERRSPVAELGATQNATELVPGDAVAVRANVGTLRARAASAESAGDGLIDIDTGAWVGKAGAAFRDKFSYEPNKWYDA